MEFLPKQPLNPLYHILYGFPGPFYEALLALAQNLKGKGHVTPAGEHPEFKGRCRP